MVILVVGKVDEQQMRELRDAGSYRGYTCGHDNRSRAEIAADLLAENASMGGNPNDGWDLIIAEHDGEICETWRGIAQEKGCDLQELCAADAIKLITP